MIVCVPSKGRPSTKVDEVFSGCDVYFFVEPQDYNTYNKENIVNIGENNKGIAYARNFINAWAVKNNHDVIIVCDDDITQLGYASNGKCKAVKELSKFKSSHDVFKRSQFVMAGFNMRQFAWSETKNYKVNNGKVEGMIMIKPKMTPWKYKENTKEDRDFLMQCLDNKRNFITFCKLFYNTPAVGSNDGGLHDEYTAKKDSAWAKNLKLSWGKYAKIINQYGRTDCKLDYKQKAIDMGLTVK